MIEPGFARRLGSLPPYLFVRMDAMKRKAVQEGVDLIDLSIGDPDMPTPGHIVAAMQKAVRKPEHHRYPSYEGMPAFRQAAALWYRRRFKVSLDPGTEVLTLIGSKEGIGHIPLAFAEPGDVVLYTSPGYPVYPVGALFAGARPFPLPLREDNLYLPDLKSIPARVRRTAKMLFINYPNNPVSATAPKRFFEEVVEFALRNKIIVCHDAAYSEIYFDGRRPRSFMQTPGAREVGIEFHSLSKTYNMTGWRLGLAVGNRHVLAGLGRVKSNLDSGVFQAVQEAGIAAFDTPEKVLSNIRDRYQERRDVLYPALKSLGLQARVPAATFYLWVKCPRGFDSMGFSAHLLERAGVLATPGVGFGEAGEGYVRFALTVPSPRIKEAAERIKKAL